MQQRPTVADINRGSGTPIEIGCGAARARPGYVTIDMQDLPSVDIVGDAREVLSRIEDGKVSAFYASHFLEHIDDVTGFVNELERVSQVGATWDIAVPHFSNPWFYSDVTHRNFFGLYSFCYLADDRVEFSRKVPGYARNERLRLTNVRLCFGSQKRWFLRHYFRKALQVVFNLSPAFQEFYEDCLSSVFPCYQIEYRVSVVEPRASQA